MAVPPNKLAPEKIEALQRFWRAHKRVPSYAEMCRLFGYSSKNAVFRLVQKFIDAGYLQKTEDGRLAPADGKLGIPFVGSIQAGFPSLEEEQHLDRLSLDDYLIDKPDNSFILKVSGDSMIEAGIHEGDMIVVEREVEPKSGDIVVACVDREWTLKYYRLKGSQIELVPANSRYPTFQPKQELTIGGVVRSVIRKYSP